MSNSNRPTRRSRRRSGATGSTDDSSVADTPITSSPATSPLRRRGHETEESVMSFAGSSLVDLKRELAARLMSQLRSIRDRVQEDGAEELSADIKIPKEELQLCIGSGPNDIDGSFAVAVDSVLGSAALSPKIRSPRTHTSANANAAITTKLPPISIKVEDVVPDSPSTSYVEQQPSTSSAMTASQSALSFSASVSQATPRGSTATGAESNVERAAKQEAQVLARVAELRRQGLWTASRLPMIDMPPRNKTHWDYLLEEVRWMAADFRQERIFKRHAAKKFAVQITRMIKDKEMEEERSEQRAVKEAKRVCGIIAKMVRDFWQNVDRVVDFRAQEIIESMKRKALDQQLELMVGHANKLSELVQEGLQAEKSSGSPSVAAEDDEEGDDADFMSRESDSDDESTIAKAEELYGTNHEEEMKALEKESELELDDLLDSLPPGYLEGMGLSKPGTSKMDSPKPGAQESADEGGSEEITDAEEDSNESESSDEDGRSLATLKQIARQKRRATTEREKCSPSVQSQESTRSVSSMSVSHKEGDESMPASEETSKDLSEGINYERLTSENSEVRQKELTNIAEEALKLQPKGFTLETTQVKTEVPHLIKGTLREYQMVGLDWLVTLYEKGLNGILADEMGLGKTIQTIALLAHLACKDSVWGPHLIVVPTSVILNWEMELKKWCPAFKILTYFGSQKERAEKRKGWSKPNAFHVCVTSYKIITQDIRSFKQKAWQYFILDEAQNIKNFKSQRWQMLLNIRARRRLLLTGTPLQNSLMELWSLMHFLMPAIFASHNDFKDWFSNPLTDMMEGNTEWNAPLVQRLHKVLRPFILRRLKSEVEKQLPEKIEHVVKCPLSKRQRYLYDDFMARRSTRENLRSGSVMSVLNIVMQLRKCCNHPNLFEQRPIISPLAMRPITLTVPSVFFDLASSSASDANFPKIPEFLLLSRHIRGSSFSYNETRRLAATKALIEDLSTQGDYAPLPKVDGFKFVRPPPARSLKSPGEESRKIAVSNSLPPREVPRSSEYYVCVDDNGTARLIQMVTTSSGQRAIVECDPSTVAGAGAPVATRGIVAQVPISPAPTGSSGFQFTVFDQVKEESVENVDDRRTAQPQRLHPVEQRVTRSGVEVVINPALSTRTALETSGTRVGNVPKQEFGAVNNGCTSLLEGRQPTPASTLALTSQGVSSQNLSHPTSSAPQSSGFSTLVSIPITNGLANSEPSSPLPKRRKVMPERGELQPFSELLLAETRAAMRNLQKERLIFTAEVNMNRLDSSLSRRAPFVSDELLSIIIAEMKKKHRRRLRENGRMSALSGFECFGELSWLNDKLRSWTEEMVQRFTVFVHGAVADAPNLIPSSSGRPAYISFAEKALSEQCSRVLSEADPLISQSLAMHKLQFPELRLIEYDCGKLQVLSSLLRDLFLYKHRCLIFTQMSRMLDVLQAFLSFHGYQYFRLDGTTAIEQRQAMMERFNADPKIFCFILSTRSGGIGVNLTGADTVIFYDSDWNPTMDAQAQDRCHRIGQTRNVTIYRLISERTIEENILRKAMQKRRLGEMAIDEAGFTPEFFKGDNLRDLFEGDDAVADVVAPVSVSDTKELEKAMATLEDVQDVAAANRANAEANAELAEFDESQHASPESFIDKDSKYFELINQLKPIERYAVNFLEAEYKPDFEEEVKEAEAMIASKKDEWLKAHEKAMDKEDNEEDEFDLTYASGFGVAGSVDEMICLEFPDNGFMPMWMPPSPPISDSENDVYYDATGDYWYEREPMSESRLPSTIHELHRPKPLVPQPPAHAAVVPTPQPAISDSALHANTTATVLSSAAPHVVSLSSSANVAPQFIMETASPMTIYSGVTPLEREQRINTVPQTGALSGAPYLDTSNLLRPATPSRIPNSVDDAIDTVRKSAQKIPPLPGHSRSSYPSSRSLFGDSRSSKNDMRRPFTPPPREKEESDYEGPEWTICEDQALLAAVKYEQSMPYHMHSSKAGHITNWDFVSGFIRRVTPFYRSPRQCSLHYQLVVQPREEGRTMTLDPISKKTRKVPVTSVELMHMKRGRTTTKEQYMTDAQKLLTNKAVQKIKAVKAVSAKRIPPFQRPISQQNVFALAECSSASHELKLSEFGVRYQNDISSSELTERREERRTKLYEQEKERQRIKEEEERQKETVAAEQQNERDQQVQRRESAVVALPGIIHYQRTSIALVEQSQQQLSVAVGASSTGVNTVPVVGVRSFGTGIQQTQIAASATGISAQNVAASDPPEVHIGQRGPSDHQQIATISTVSSAMHHTGARRLTIPASNSSQTQHQIVMSSSPQINQTTSQQPYTVVVSSQDNILTGGGSQQIGTRIQYTTRQDGVGERQTIYRAIAPTGAKRTPPATPVQRVGLPVGYPGSSAGNLSTQIYSTTTHGGRTMIVSSQPAEGSSFTDQPQLQVMRPQLQPVGATNQRQDIRPKITQRAQNRVYLTTTGGERTYLMPQSQMRMLPSGQRIAQKRTGGSLQTKPLGGQPQVTMMVPSRSSALQQVRTVSRNVGTGYQGTRMPSINLIMGGSSGARNSETIGGSGTTRQLPPPGSQIITSGGVAHSRQVLTTSSQGPISRQVAAINAQNAANAGGNSGNVQGGTASTLVRSLPASTLSTQEHFTTVAPQQTQSLPPISLSSQPPASRLTTVTSRSTTAQPTNATPSSPHSQTPTSTGSSSGTTSTPTAPPAE